MSDEITAKYRRQYANAPTAIVARDLEIMEQQAALLTLPQGLQEVVLQQKMRDLGLEEMTIMWPSGKESTLTATEHTVPAVGPEAAPEMLAHLRVAVAALRQILAER